MISGNTNIVEFLRSNGCTHWRIKRSEKSEIIIQSDDKEPQTTDECIAQFQQRVTILDPGNYFIEAYQKEAARNTWKKDSIYIKGDTTAQPTQNNNAVGAIMDPETISRIATEAVEKYKREEHYKLLEQKNKELEENQNSITTQFMERATPIIGLIGEIIAAKMGVPMPKAITGTQYNTPKNNTSMPQQNIDPKDLQQRAETAMEKWLNLDKEAIDLLEKIVDLAENNPGKYNMAKSLL